MKRYFISILLILIFSTFGYFNIESNSLEFIDSDYFLGILFPNEVIKFDIKFKNRLTEDVLIKKIQTSCGCTSANISRRTIPKGDTGIISVKFNTGSDKGKKTVSLAVFTDKDEKPYSIVITSLISDPWIVDPTEIVVSEILPGDKIRKRLYIDNRDDKNFTIKSAFVENLEQMVCDIGDYQEGKGYPIDLNFKSNIYVESITHLSLKTNRRDYAISVPVKIKMVPKITMHPDGFDFGIVKSGKNIKKSILIKKDNDINIKEIKKEDKYIDVICAEIKDDSLIVTAEIDTSNLKGVIHGVITILSDNIYQPVCKIPYSVMVL